MIKIFFLIIFFFLSFAFIKCNSSNLDCNTKVFNFSNTEYMAKGCISDNLENGEWFFYDHENKLMEKGYFKKGFREGMWHYPQNNADTVIAWKKYEKNNLKLAFNIPSRLFIVEDSLEYIKFSNKDTLNLFNLVLSIHKLDQSSKKIENYYKQGEEEILVNGWAFTSKKNKFITSHRELYFIEYFIRPISSDSFKLLNAYGLINDKEILEISCRFSKEVESTAKIIFFSVLTNVFYSNQRFINPLDKIKQFQID